MKNKGLIITVMVIALIGGVSVYAYSRNRNKKLVDEGEKPKGKKRVGSIEVGSTVKVDPSMEFTKDYKFEKFPISMGDSGNDVVQLQYLLYYNNPRLMTKKDITGKFGTTTRTALTSMLGKTKVESEQDINTLINRAKSQTDTLMGIFRDSIFGKPKTDVTSSADGFIETDEIYN